ncbi:unnamed protein product [Cuscuta epithymum]|uniref:NAC domain-containing protein n=1 Tax=Cuscuta epithymum TaxID=186058 RepID=A0AAV0FH24_9ASTE|nr:unnamed protein product [Cuscuta epithymum]
MSFCNSGGVAEDGGESATNDRAVVDKYFNEIPVGYRFVPTDEELVVHYLKNKILGRPLPRNRILTCNIYESHPQILFRMYGTIRESACYFFTTREKMNANGSRPKRKAVNGYWRASGRDEPVRSSKNNQVVGSKRTLNYFEGTHQLKGRNKGMKTNWMMHEYISTHHPNSIPHPSNPSSKMKLDDYVLVKIYQKAGTTTPPENEDIINDSMENKDEMGMVSLPDKKQQVLETSPVELWSSSDGAGLMLGSSELSFQYNESDDLHIQLTYSTPTNPPPPPPPQTMQHHHEINREAAEELLRRRGSNHTRLHDHSWPAKTIISPAAASCRYPSAPPCYDFGIPFIWQNDQGLPPLLHPSRLVMPTRAASAVYPPAADGRGFQNGGCQGNPFATTSYYPKEDVWELHGLVAAAINNNNNNNTNNNNSNNNNKPAAEGVADIGEAPPNYNKHEKFV